MTASNLTVEVESAISIVSSSEMTYIIQNYQFFEKNYHENVKKTILVRQANLYEMIDIICENEI